jgi:anti-sigma regulatory factor (Ser/Thr protein kinase)
VEAFSIEADLAGGTDAARRARELIRSELAGRVPGPVLADLALLLTELVANGVRHGGAGADSALHLRLERRPAALRVEVGDPGSTPAPIAPRRPDGDGGGGLGLHIVELVASRWGVHEGPSTSVWFELDCMDVH